MRDIMERLKLTVNEEKTRVRHVPVDYREGSQLEVIVKGILGRFANERLSGVR